MIFLWLLFPISALCASLSRAAVSFEVRGREYQASNEIMIASVLSGQKICIMQINDLCEGGKLVNL